MSGQPHALAALPPWK